MNFFDLTFTVGDIIVILGFAWQFFNYKRRLESVEKRLDNVEHMNQQNWTAHIKPMSKIISDWKGTDDKKGMIPQMMEDIESIKTTMSGLSENNLKRIR